MQLAADDPNAVRSLTLLEPAIMQIPSGEALGQALAKVTEPATQGDFDKAAGNFLRTIFGREYRQYIEYNVGPNALAQAFADADDALAGDIQALGSWAFGAEDAARIKCPTLFVLGGNSEATLREAFAEFDADESGANASGEMVDLGRSWIPHSEIATLGELNHALQMQDAWAVGVALAPFMAKHRTAVPA
jgi:pimeloyl-ACP methyl ester carboxylesterase